MKLILLLSVLIASSLVSGMMAASAQSYTNNPCTAVNPCNQQVCGDHICAPGEYVKMQQAAAQAQIQSSKQNTNPTAGNNQTVPASGQNTQGQAAGKVLLGVMSYNATASDGTVVVMRTGFPLSGQPLSIGIAFLNGTTKNYIQNQNYAITITQDNAVVLSNLNGNTQSGIDTLTTSALASADPVNIKITLNGVGLPSAYPTTWTGVKGEVLSFGSSTSNMTTTTTPPTTSPPTTNETSGNNAVPEFGPIASLVLVIAVVSVIAVTVKTRVFLKL